MDQNETTMDSLEIQAAALSEIAHREQLERTYINDHLMRAW
jgi:hypothetical protein